MLPAAFGGRVFQVVKAYRYFVEDVLYALRFPTNFPPGEPVHIKCVRRSFSPEWWSFYNKEAGFEVRLLAAILPNGSAGWGLGCKWNGIKRKGSSMRG
jgi:hypothetical protein